MSVKFAIRNTAEKAKKEGDSFIRYSGTGEPFFRKSERAARVLDFDANGFPSKWQFVTGLEEDQVDLYKWLSDEEKEVVKKTIAELKPTIERFYGGKSVVNSENSAFWRGTREVHSLKLTHDDIDIFYDTEKPQHALLYLSILAGAFTDIVAPNKEWAERYHLPHYMVLEMDTGDWAGEEDVTRSDAHAELALLRREFGKDALYILAWCLQYDTNAFGAYNYSTTEKDLVNYHIKYIDGKLVTKKKKNMPKTFIEYAEKWRGAQTRPLLMVEAYVKAGEYFNFIKQAEKKFVTAEGTVLGNTVKDAVDTLMKHKYKQDLENLRNAVEAKWKE